MEHYHYGSCSLDVEQRRWRYCSNADATEPTHSLVVWASCVWLMWTVTGDRQWRRVAVGWKKAVTEFVRLQLQDGGGEVGGTDGGIVSWRSRASPSFQPTFLK